MGNLFEDFKTEDSLEIDGVWKPYNGHTQIKLTRSGGKNTKYYKDLAEIAEKYNDDEDQIKPWAELFAESVIKGWKSKVDGKWIDGIIFPEGLRDYSKKNVIEALVLLPDFFSILKKDADNLKTFQKQTQEKDLKN